MSAGTARAVDAPQWSPGPKAGSTPAPHQAAEHDHQAAMESRPEGREHRAQARLGLGRRVAAMESRPEGREHGVLRQVVDDVDDAAMGSRSRRPGAPLAP